METVYCHQFHAGSAGSWNLVIFGGNLVKESWYFSTQEVQVVNWSLNLGEEKSSQHQERLHGVENETNDSSWGWNQERSLPCLAIWSTWRVTWILSRVTGNCEGNFPPVLKTKQIISLQFLLKSWRDALARQSKMWLPQISPEEWMLSYLLY